MGSLILLQCSSIIVVSDLLVVWYSLPCKKEGEQLFSSSYRMLSDDKTYTARQAIGHRRSRVTEKSFQKEDEIFNLRNA